MVKSTIDHSRSQKWISQLQSSGFRLTGPRYIIVDILARSERALSAQELYDQASQYYPSIGLVSVYRTLEILDDLNLIQRVHLPQKCHAYIAAFDGHQHLLICQKCGLVEFFQGDDLESLFTRVETESGYEVKEHWLQLFGLCSNCRNQE
jgi:Fur family transcriptional regulator, ferric uptake regulator